MAGAETAQVRRGMVMVGPPYLYNGSQVCGRRTGRTCIFLLASFGTACTLIGLVLFTADLRMESGLWIGGVAAILLGAVQLVWFLTLCCAARCAFKKLPAYHPARTMPSNAVLVPPRSSTYQLLPLSPNRVQVTPSSTVSTRTQLTPASYRPPTQTLPMSASNKTREAAASGYPTWGHGGRNQVYMSGQSRVQPTMYSWGNTPSFNGMLPVHEEYPPNTTMTAYNIGNPLTTSTLSRPSAPRIYQQPHPQPHRSYTEGYMTSLPPGPPNSFMSGYVADDNPPPYHTVVSRP